MEIIIVCVVIILAVFLVLLGSVRFTASSLSSAEVSRRVAAGDPQAQHEQQHRRRIPIYVAVVRLKKLLLTVLIVVLFSTILPLWLAGAAAFGVLLLVQLVVARAWFKRPAAYVQGRVEAQAHILDKIAPFVAVFAASPVNQPGAVVASRDELRELIAADTEFLSPQDKARLLGAFHFGALLVADVMVPHSSIKAVGENETVGPVLLDRLHKTGHNVYVGIGKDIHHIKGLLYMADLVPLDPSIAHVKDALRPTVHYISALAPLESVLAASLKTGRQLFIVVDQDGRTKGLITLADALARLNGQPLPKVAPVSTSPGIEAQSG